MLHRRVSLAELEPAYRALEDGRYDVAFSLLESAASRHDGPAQRLQRAQIKLHLAAIYALYREDGLEGGLKCLREAADLAPEITHIPLCRGLYWEFAAYLGEPSSDVRAGALAVTKSDDHLASYHAASALVHAESFGDAETVLLSLDGRLPSYLSWRRWSLLGQAYERSDQGVKAVRAYRQAVGASSGYEQQRERLNLASSLLELERFSESLQVLKELDEDLLEDKEERAFALFLQGRSHLHLDNPNRALELLLKAQDLEEDEPSYEVGLALAQTHAVLGHTESALAAYERATAVADESQRATTQHEHAFTLFENDYLLEAREVLWEVVKEDGYEYRAEVFADLAEIESRLGNLSEAEALAQRALDMGAVASACLCLGHIAYEYYRFEEAVAWFEQALSECKRGEPDWLMAHEMLSEVYAQQGEQYASSVIYHAEAALQHLKPNSDWAITLNQRLVQAREQLGGHNRLLN